MTLTSFDEIRQYFASNSTPYYFVNPTNFNLIDMHNWVGNWQDINFIDCFDQGATYVDVSAKSDKKSFNSLEAINEYLLTDESGQHVFQQQAQALPECDARVLFLFFNKAIEAICKEKNLTIQLPDNDLIKSIDNKITTTEIGNQAGVFSVPNVLAKVDSYQQLMMLAQTHHLGEKLVVQTAFGDSGKTTFFINNETDYKRVAAQIESESEVKIMKCIRCIGSAIEACATKQGTYVGPLLTELIGFEQLTPYQGGWCGNELYQEAFSTQVRASVHEKTERLGNALYQRGYRGYFEVDYLLDLDDGEVYLGELNPRITGISAMTNMSAFCQQTMPLFLFHLLEYSDVDVGLLPREYNQQSLARGAGGIASQMILKHCDKESHKIHNAPISGVYRLVDGQLSLEKATSNPIDKGDDPDLAYVLRIMDSGEYAYQGGDLAIVFLNTQITTAQGQQLNQTAQHWLNAVKSAFDIRPLTAEEQQLLTSYHSPNSLKGS